MLEHGTILKKTEVFSMLISSYLAGQVLHLQKACNMRLNVIKILSHKSWSININRQALITIYKSLIRSVLDYSLFLFDVFPRTTQEKIQRIQNNALRIIFKKKSNFSAINLHDLAKIDTIQTRARLLTKNYVSSCRLNRNPLYQELFSGFETYSKLNCRIKTLLE